jgi:hypothetical protein
MLPTPPPVTCVAVTSKYTDTPKNSVNEKLISTDVTAL